MSFSDPPNVIGLTHQLFVRKWTQVVESGISPCPIVQGFDVIKGDAPFVVERGTYQAL